MKKENHSSDCSQSRFTQGLPVVNHHAAGIDIGDSKHDVAIFDINGDLISREYGSFTSDLEELVAFLKEKGVTTVAMESTGVYWICLFILLEEAGIEPYLVNAKHVKNVTGRKKDDTDSIWILKLHSCGLLQKSFQPDLDIRVLRTYIRQRKKLVSLCSDTVRRMQKSLELINIKLHLVISDILGKTGMGIVNAIMDGERDPEKLLQFKDSRIQASDELIVESLHGIWKEEYLFMLKQNHHGYMFYQSQIQECDIKIEGVLLEIAAKKQNGDISNLQSIKKNPKKNDLTFNARPILKVIVGVDLCNVDGMSEVSSVELISEIGTDMSKWKNSKHFSAWLNLVPNTKITGGKLISSKMQKKKNNAGQTLRMACCNLSRSKMPIGDYARKMKSRLGKKGGVVATAHKLSRVIYTMIREQKEFNKSLLMEDQEKWKLKKINYLEKELIKLKKAS
ncbi:MAG: IS110 family transposase [Marinifilum sp.]|jgi:transposase|nr:IS110 family transposase [Marinifilum sp.]